MSKLDVFFGDTDFEKLDISIHRQIVDEFTDQYFDSDEFLDDIRNCNKLDKSSIEKNIPLLRLITKTLYRTSVLKVLKEDLIPTAFDQMSIYFNKLKLDILTSPLNNIDAIPLITTDEFYNYMVTFDEICQRYIIDKVRVVDLKTKNNLLLSIQSHDKDKFYQIMDGINCDITNVFKIAFLINLIDITIPIFEKAIKEEDFGNLKNFSFAKLINKKIDELEVKISSPDLSEIERMTLTDRYMQLSLGGIKIGFEDMLSVLPTILQDIVLSRIPPKSYELYKEIVVPEEVYKMKNYADTMMEHEYITLGFGEKSLEQQFYSNALPEPTTESDEDTVLYPDSSYGFIPEDYFSQKIDKTHPQDHYDLKDDIQNEGEEKFAEFINYVAKCQYIENNNKTKALFAYRLTGRLRPADEDLKPIIWCGADNKPEELLYTIRYITTSNRPGMYSKLMKAFFEGPDWPSKGCSSKADDAKTEFRQTLNSIFGDVCGMKYNTKRKKRH